MAGGSRKILIVGAGPVGLAAALELARRGFSPRIVDDGDGPTPLAESRALGINARTLTLLSPSGVTEQILAQAQDIGHFRLASKAGMLADVDTHRIAGRFGAMHGLPQGATERILLSALEGHGIVPEWHTKVAAIGPDTGQPQAVLHHRDRSQETVAADILIGTDGAHSVVRKALGLGFPGQALEDYFYLADFRYVQPVDSHFAEISLFNPGMVGRLPVAGDTLRFISTLADFERLIVHPENILEKTWSSQFQIHFRHVAAMASGNIFLAGDAAHIHSPAGARGMNLGIEDACWLAYLISEGREQDYSGQRLPAVRQVLKQTRRLTDLVTMKSPLATAVRDRLVPLLFRLPPVRRLLLRSIAGYDTPRPPWIDWAE
jgi:2-polyprenyl-6-methoxyphenol hydroxylase-like FAD-dependent oxidoreductase